MKFAERVKSLRTQQRYSQSQFSNLIGVKPNTIWRWENDKAKPDTETIVKIAKALNTTAAYLLGETDSSNVSDNGQLSLKTTVSEQQPNMLIIQEGERKIFFPNNEEGRRLFLSVLASDINDEKLQVVSNAINGNNNSGNKLGVINN